MLRHGGVALGCGGAGESQIPVVRILSFRSATGVIHFSLDFFDGGEALLPFCLCLCR